ncbi:UPF0688 protein C1orf174 homolog [Dryobates pubescens]|uniref:UPF0688 protein C1orf174 homolog n=1 Tax=Dryobates pubescens TaxID=118200 RepID=UPI0023B9247C|nr:UPF0688 protein C1orf174 homolog [Dryobates pubescens]
MAAGGAARRPRTGAGAPGWGRTDTRGQAFPERQQAPGRSAKGLPEGERPQTAPAEPARAEAAARRQRRGGPGTQGAVGGPGRAAGPGGSGGCERLGAEHRGQDVRCGAGASRQRCAAEPLPGRGIPAGSCPGPSRAPGCAPSAALGLLLGCRGLSASSLSWPTPWRLLFSAFGSGRCSFAGALWFHCSSRRAAGRRPSKRLKSEKPAPANPELEAEELRGGAESPAGLGEAPQPSDGDQRSEDPGECSLLQQGEGEGTAERSEDTEQEEEEAAPPEPPAEPGREDPLQLCSEEERSCQSLLSEESSLGDADVPRSLLELESSALLNEDSNQPMPVARFFGDVQLLQDLPAAAPPSTMMSRRELRKLHIIAKEEEEEEEEEEDVV